MECNAPDFKTEPAGDGLNNVYINGVKQPGTYTMAEAIMLCDSKREKTADEMFAELGFQKVYTPLETAMYLNPEGGIVEVQEDGEGLFLSDGTGDDNFIYLHNKEILACAQLIKEMEATNAND